MKTFRPTRILVLALALMALLPAATFAEQQPASTQPVAQHTKLVTEQPEKGTLMIPIGDIAMVIPVDVLLEILVVGLVGVGAGIPLRRIHVTRRRYRS